MKPTKLGAILTFATPEEAEMVGPWAASARSVFVMTDGVVPKDFGIVKVVPKRGTLQEALQHHTLRMRGKEMIGICFPGLVLPNDFAPVGRLMADRLEMSWGFYASAYDNPVALVIITTSLLPHILRDLKADVKFNHTCLPWLYEWLKKHMQPHKFFDVTDELSINDLQPIPYVPVEEPVVATKTKVKRKKK